MNGNHYPHLIHPDEVRRACHESGMRSDIMFARIGREQQERPAAPTGRLLYERTDAALAQPVLGEPWEELPAETQHFWNTIATVAADYSASLAARGA